MKKHTLILVFLLLGAVVKSFGQKLEENKKDDFTNASVKRTSWETLVSNSSANIHFRVSNVGDLESFDLKIMLDKMFGIEQDKELMLKLDDGSVVTLKNGKDSYTCEGCGAVGLKGSAAPGISVFYPVSNDQIKMLKAHKVSKVRISLDDGYFDEDVKSKNADKITAAFNLL